MGHLFGCSAGYELASTITTLGAYINKVVGALDDFHVVLDNEDGVSASDECIERLHQTLDIVEMKSCGWLIEDKQGGLGLFEAEIVGEFHALILTTREG